MPTPSTPSRFSRFWAGIFSQSSSAAPLLAFTLLLTACASPNTYGTARTLDRGELRGLIAIETFQSDDNGQMTRSFTGGIRVGIAEDVDMGARVHNLLTLGLDMKLQLVRGGFDVALDPGLVISPFPGDGLATFAHLPLMLTHHLGESFSTTIVPGISYGHVTGGAPGNSNSHWDFSTIPDTILTGPIGRLGVGFQVHASKRISFGPEITAMVPLRGEHSARFFGGIGAHF